MKTVTEPLPPARLLGRQLAANRVAYAEDGGDGETVVLARNYTNGVPSIEGVYRYSDYGEELLRELRANRPVVRPDIANDSSLSHAEKKAHAVLQLGATLNVPLVKDGRLVAIFAVHYIVAHEFSASEIGLVCETAERTWAAVQRARAEAALRQSEERLLTFNSLVPVMLWQVDSSGHHQILNVRWFEYTGQTLEQTHRGGWLDAIHPDDRTTSWKLYEEAVAGRRAMEFQHRIRAQDGSYRWFQVRQVPILDREGNITQWFGAAVDVHEQRLAVESLRASEERFRQFGEASSDVLWIRDAESLQIDYVSPAFERIYGTSIDRVADGDNYLNWFELVLPEDRDRAVESIRRVQKGEKSSLECRIRGADGVVRWLRDTEFPIRDGDGRIVRIGGIAQDITEEKESSQRLQVMVDELKHRTRNLLAIVQSIANQTARSTTGTDDFLERFGDRLNALGKVQNLLSKSDSFEITMRTLVAAEIDALASGDLKDRIIIEGPPVRLRNSAVQMLSLAVHELATNARKYGALARPEGTLSVEWSVVNAETCEARLEFQWHETGTMPPPGSSKGKGYGRHLIEKALPMALGGESTFDLNLEGLRFRFSVPLSKIQKT